MKFGNSKKYRREFVPTYEEIRERIAEIFPALSAKERMAKLNEYLANVIERLSEPIERHTIQIWSNDYPQNPMHRPDPHGSGVLVRLDENHFIATASHVVEDRHKTHIGVYTRQKDFFELGSVSNSTVSHSTSNDNADIAIWYIEPGIVVDIAPVDWWYDLQDAVYAHQEMLQERYLVYGFPCTKIEIKASEQALIQYPFKFMTRSARNTIEGQRAIMDPKLNFLVEFHRKKVANVRDGHREWAPDPHGISGGGLWYLHPDTGRFHLAGILTEWKQPEEHLPLMKATRIELVRTAISQLLGELDI